MSLLDDLQTFADTKPRCKTCTWHETLTPSERDGINTAINRIRNGEGNYAALHRVLAKHGLNTNEKSFREHCHKHHDQLVK